MNKKVIVVIGPYCYLSLQSQFIAEKIMQRVALLYKICGKL